MRVKTRYMGLKPQKNQHARRNVLPRSFMIGNALEGRRVSEASRMHVRYRCGN
jgi:hypothetical protein